MAMFLKQSTTVTIMMGPALDKTDGVTEETALSPTVNLSKNGAAFTARSSATAITHDTNGYYRVELNTTDTNTAGLLRAMFHAAATHLPVWHDFMVLPAQVYDSLVAGTDALQVHTNEMTANLITSSIIAANAIGASQIASGAFTLAKFAAGAIDSTILAANAIGASQLATGAITSTKFGAGAIDSAAIAANAIGASQIAANAFTSAKFASGCLAAANFNADFQFYQALGVVGVDAAGKLWCYARLIGPNGATFNASALTAELLDYDDTSIIGTGAWTTAPTENAGTNTWYFDKAAASLVDGMAYKVRLIFDSTYTRYLDFNYRST